MAWTLQLVLAGVRLRSEDGRQRDWLQAQSQAVGQDLGRVEKQDAISVRRVRTHERNEDLFVPGICLEDEGGIGLTRRDTKATGTPNPARREKPQSQRVS
jgi:hypothetical protein